MQNSFRIWGLSHKKMALQFPLSLSFPFQILIIRSPSVRLRPSERIKCPFHSRLKADEKHLTRCNIWRKRLLIIMIGSSISGNRRAVYWLAECSRTYRVDMKTRDNLQPIKYLGWLDEPIKRLTQPMKTASSMMKSKSTQQEQ